MGTPFPGMDPYLERRGLWEQTHLWIVVMAQDVLNAQITPKYRAAIAQRTYTAITELPIPEEITERYLEIREVSTDRVITVIELLSPSNKLSREGRDEYEPMLPLNRLLHELYDRARYDLVIHYDRPAEPPVNELDAAWVQSIIKP